MAELGADLLRAALLGAFDPRALLDVDATDGKDRLRALAAVSTEVQVGPRWLWTLTPDARREGLSRLPPPEARGSILEDLPTAVDDPLGRMLRQALIPSPAPAEVTRLTHGKPRAEDLPDLMHLLQAVEMLRNAGVVLEGWAADTGLGRQLSRVAVLAYKAAASQQILPGKLRGRAGELAGLLEFAMTGVASSPPFKPPDGPVQPGPQLLPTVILSGLGGSGKSTLLEALRRRLERDPAVLQVTFDLDQPSLRAGHRLSLTQELLRQIGQERPVLDARLATLRQGLRDALATTTEGSDPSSEARAVLSTLSELNALLNAEAGVGAIRLVVIFDTFEEALTLGPDRVRLISDWIALVGAQRLSPRVILSGREADSLGSAALPGLAVQGSILLGELGATAGRALLRDRFRADGIAALNLVPDLVTTFGSDPLTLLMLSRFARNAPGPDQAVRDELADLARGEKSSARDRLDAEMRQSFLFSRILNRLPDPRLRALASPGLVLRRITPQLIADVLAVPCGLGADLPMPEAVALFATLSAMVWLVRPVGTGGAEVEHRPELRRRMLPQVLAEPNAQAVAEAAAAWFDARAAQGEAGAALEAIYYRALRDPESLPNDPATLRALADRLGPAIGDLDFARDRFRDAMGGVVSKEAVAGLADPEAKRRAVKRRRDYQLSEGLESTVLAEAAAGTESDEPMPAALVVSHFAALHFDAIAPEAPRLARSLFDQLVSGTDFAQSTKGASWEQGPDVAEAALLAATACLAPELGPDPREYLRGELQGWLGDAGQQDRFSRALAGAIQGSPQGWQAMLSALLVLRIASLEGTPAIAEAVPGLAVRSAHPFAWRVLRLQGLAKDDSALQAWALPFLSPDILPILNLASDFGTSSPVADALKAILGARGTGSINDQIRLEAALSSGMLSLSDELFEVAELKDAVPGRLPEFHGAFRLLLGGEALQPGVLGAAVAELSAQIAWWPKELAPAAFQETPTSPTLISSLIDTADKCGRLPALANALAAQQNAPRDAARLAAMIGATLAFYRTSAGLDPR